MAGKIVADTLEHSTAGSIATNYVVEGSAKAWVNFDGTGTIATRDSLNVSGLTDNGTGDYSVSFISSIANADFSGTVTGTYTDSGMTSVSTPFTCRSFSTSSMRPTGAGLTNNGLDMVRMCTSVFGDLA